MTQVPESTAAVRSTPVPTSGFSARRQGTAWRCMLEPISARLASSCSRNGMSEAATDTIWDGATSMYSILSEVERVNSLRWRHDTSSSTNLPTLSSSALAWAMTYLPSSMADRYSMSLETLPSFTRRYGVSMKPKSLVRAYRASELIRPMFGPSG